MKIGFDGKRAFQNSTGLGNYSRSLIAILSRYYPDNAYTLFAPEQTNLFNTDKFVNINAVFPSGKLYRHFPSLWRRSGMVKEITAAELDIFHGLSNELPAGIQRTGIKSVVTVHDLIFERFPKTYKLDERYVHRWKIKPACKAADAIISISRQTKDDLVNFYKIPEEKIFICYQSCNPAFQQGISEEEKAIVKKRYGLPDAFFLFVSSITPRKNLITVCRAMALLKNKIIIPLVVIGNGKKEKEEAKRMMAENGISDRLILLNELPRSKETSFVTSADFPAIYQQALALIYPSVFEGFGLPVLEALWSGLPVISSDASSLPEAGGDAALYFSPYDVKQLSEYMLELTKDEKLVLTLRQKGLLQAKKFTDENYADTIMKVYKNVMG